MSNSGISSSDLTVGPIGVGTGGEALRDLDSGSALRRWAIFTYGVLAYLAFLGSFTALALFVGDLVLPRTVDRGPQSATIVALGVDLLLVLVWAVPHSVMARPRFKRWWTRFHPAAMERSTYVLVASILLVLLMAAWRPIPTVVWELEHPVAVAVLWGLFTYGWLLVVWMSFTIDHFDLFGLRQVTLQLRGRGYSPVPFQAGSAYRFIRHPMMLGMLIAFWATPRMTVGHLFLAILMTLYVLTGIRLEERTLSQELGAPYRLYLRNVPTFFPKIRRPPHA